MQKAPLIALTFVLFKKLRFTDTNTKFFSLCCIGISFWESSFALDVTSTTSNLTKHRFDVESILVRIIVSHRHFRTHSSTYRFSQLQIIMLVTISRNTHSHRYCKGENTSTIIIRAIAGWETAKKGMSSRQKRNNRAIFLNWFL